MANKMKKNKRMIAAAAAVFAYMRSEEEVVDLHQSGMLSGAPQVGAPLETPGPAPVVNVWGASGRQSQMQIRNLMQLKAFHGLKIR